MTAFRNELGSEQRDAAGQQSHGLAEEVPVRQGRD